ncbi:MAG: hypothetical protein QXT53_02535 [Ignisphaera sp.]
MAQRSKANMLVLFDSCEDIKKYIDSDANAGLIGLEEKFFEKCRDMLPLIDENNVVLVPRSLKPVSRKSIPHESSIGGAITSYIPFDTQSARTLAKIRRPSIILITPGTLKYVDEAQINFMRQSHERKFLEVALGHFVKMLGENGKGYAQVERAFRILGDVIERALKYDVGVVVSGAVEPYPKTLFTSHLDLILFSIGFSKRERRMVLEVYPFEMLKTMFGG